MVSAGLTANVTGTYDIQTQLRLQTYQPHLYLEVFNDLNNPETYRRELAPFTHFQCVIFSAKIVSQAGGAFLRIGPANFGTNGITGSFGVTGTGSITNAEIQQNLWTRFNILAAGRTREDIEAECQEWGQHIIATQSTMSLITPATLAIPVGKKLSCKYRGNDVREVDNIVFNFTKDDSGEISYTVFRPFGLRTTKTYRVAKGMNQFKVPVISVNARNDVPAAESLAVAKNALNTILTEATRRESRNWTITRCE
jgi:hypothetical protein